MFDWSKRLRQGSTGASGRTRISKDSRICILGAGPAGLSTAWFLKKAGYANVDVLEKLGRVGGLCDSISFEGRSFDLGANYLTASYTETLALAREVQADLYSEPNGIDYNPTTGAWVPIAKDCVGDTPFADFMVAVARYVLQRTLADRTLPSSGFSGVATHPELNVTFGAWLATHDLSALRRLFEVPITHMGYGTLDEIPAVYALRYMTVPTVFDLVWFASPFPKRWPKRFVLGFQRMWEKLSWQLDVETAVDVEKIVRGPDGVHVHIRPLEQEGNHVRRSHMVRDYDYLILACPLTPEILGKFLVLDDAERAIFSKIQYNPYCLTSFIVRDLTLPARIVNVCPLPPVGTPYVVSQQFEDNPFLSFYSRVDASAPLDERKRVVDACKALITKMGGTAPAEPYTFDRWPYFPHFEVEDIRGGIYDRLEALQGHQRTYYVGGVVAFELIEPIVRYAKDFVRTRFAG